MSSKTTSLSQSNSVDYPGYEYDHQQDVICVVSVTPTF